MNCPHRDQGNCKQAAILAGVAAVDICTDQACRVCSEKYKPYRDINHVTLSLALSYCDRSGQCQPPHVQRLREMHRHVQDGRTIKQVTRVELLERQSGPGTELHRLLALIARWVRRLLGWTKWGRTIADRLGIDPNCRCVGRAFQMNKWGVAGCKENGGQLLAWLIEEANRRNFKVRWYTRVTARILIMLAILRAQ